MQVFGFHLATVTGAKAPTNTKHVAELLAKARSSHYASCKKRKRALLIKLLNDSRPCVWWVPISAMPRRVAI